MRPPTLDILRIWHDKGRISAIFGTPWRFRSVKRYSAGCYVIKTGRIKAVSCGIEDLESAIPVTLDEERFDIHANTALPQSKSIEYAIITTQVRFKLVFRFCKSNLYNTAFYTT